MINPDLDVDCVRRGLEQDGVAVVESFIDSPIAARIHDVLERDVAWDLAYSGDGQGRIIKSERLARMSPQDVREAVAPALALAPGSFQFVYNMFDVIDAHRSGRSPGHALIKLADDFNAPDVLDLARAFTGRRNIERMSMMAARYLPGHFLTLHDDVHEDERREVAYILNLTRDWRPEWGGLLHIVDADRRTVRRTITPAFNTITLLRPPTWHFVSQVASYAAAPRYTLTGWMLAS